MDDIVLLSYLSMAHLFLVLLKSLLCWSSTYEEQIIFKSSHRESNMTIVIVARI